MTAVEGSMRLHIWSYMCHLKTRKAQKAKTSYQFKFFQFCLCHKHEFNPLKVEKTQKHASNFLQAAKVSVKKHEFFFLQAPKYELIF